VAGDKITEAVRILAALVGVAQDPTLLSALKAAPGLRDSLKKIAASPPASFAGLAEDLGRSAATVFASLPEKPRDAEALYLQMVEAGLPDPARIMADRMDAAAVTEGMLAGLTEREHRDPAMQALFRALTRPALERLLADKAFAADLTPAFMRAVLESLAETQRLLEEMRCSYGTLSAALEDRRHLSRTRMEALALRFGEPEPESLSDADLETFLTGKAKDLRAAQAQLSAVSDQGGRIANLKTAAEAAMADLRLDEARDLIRDALSVHRSERTLRALREDADLVEVEAQIALLRNDADEAARLLENTARSFASFDPREEFERRGTAQMRLYEHGARYGGSGLARAIDLGRSNIAMIDEAQNPVAFGATQNNLGIALHAQGERLGGAEGAVLLGEAVAAHRAALSVRTEALHPVNWAMSHNNLGIALYAQGERLGGAEGAVLFGEAVAAHRAALRVCTETEHPVEWATNQNNLGNALQAQEEQLSEAVAAYRAALCVWTEAAHPVNWAGTQDNLGVALQAQWERLGEAEGVALLGEAVAAHCAALRVLNKATYPVEWARIQNNLGNALQRQGEQLRSAVAAYRAALCVWTEAAHPVNWAKTTKNLGLANETLADNATCTDPRAALEAAAECFTNALRVFDPQAMPYDHAQATASVARVRAKLAALPDPA
jgi:tetratricopeptide (TPR) repeat protein